MEITIRKAEKKDAERLVELLHTIAELHHKGRPDFYLGGSKYTVKDIEKKLCDKEQLILVAVNEEDFVAGYTMSKIYDVKQEGVLAPMKKMYIDDVCVDSAFRGCGVGKKLMDATKQAAIDAKCHVADLNVWAFNEGAVEFYKSCGMKVQRIYMEYVLD